MAELAIVDLLGELAGGGLVICDEFPAEAPAGAREPDEVAFRTLIQIDGDVCLTIHSDALALPDFDAALARHHEHIATILAAKQDRLRRLTTLVVRRGRVLGFVAGAGSGSYVGEVKLVLLSLSAEVTIVASASVGALLFGLLGRAGVRAVLRRRGLGRYRLRDDEQGS